jgi:hypothetical protein
MTFDKLDNATQWWIVGIVSGVVILIGAVTAAKEGFSDEYNTEERAPNSRDSDSTASGLTKRKRKNHKKSHKKRK